MGRNVAPMRSTGRQSFNPSLKWFVAYQLYIAL